MKKIMFFVAMMMAAGIATAGVNKSVVLSVDAGKKAITNDVSFWQGGAAVDHIIVNNTSDTAVTVTVAKYDCNVQTALFSGSVGANTSTNVFPRNTVGESKEMYIVDNIRYIAAISQVATNAKSVAVFIQNK